MSGVSLAAIGPAPETVLARVASAVGRAFSMPVERLPPLPEPEAAYSPARRQWDAALLLRLLLARGQDGGRVLGLTERDLFSPVLSFVYGQAQLRGRAAVVSLARLRPEFHGFSADAAVLERRAAAEAVHEIGHTFGLVHCPDRRCPMSLSIDLADLDGKGEDPCPACSALLEEGLEATCARAEGG
ncbi:MAG TPA: peptidase M54 [Vicinamibacteria bacterium]|nr:peptidase M54 [Vicinamibacteria bacterium]